MDDGRRKLPSWMLGNHNNNHIESKIDEDNRELIKRRQRTRVSENKRKKSGDDEGAEAGSSDVLIGCELRKKRMKSKVDDVYGCVEDGNEIQVGKRKRGGRRGKAKSDLVDGIGNDDDIEGRKRKNVANIREREVISNEVESDDDHQLQVEKKNCSIRSRNGYRKSDVDGSKKSAAEEDEDGSGTRVAKRKCNGKRGQGKGKYLLDGNNDLVTGKRSLESVSDDEDLTMEDLLSIAEEYVKADKEAEQHQLSPSKDDSDVGDLVSITEENLKENKDVGIKYTAKRLIQEDAGLGRSSCSGQFNNTVSNREEVGSPSVQTKNVKANDGIIKPNMSGDPTQDMLDLLLGPLLKKTQDKEKKFEVISQDINLAVQRQKPIGAPIDAVPLTKKKTSLKDKVALFLD